jgi:transcriptional regulator with XRE-family HTH domain
MYAHRVVTRHDLRRLRLQHGISVHELARKVHASPSTVMDMEDGVAPIEDHDLLERALAAMARLARA